MKFSYLEKAPVEDTTQYEKKYQWMCRCNIERSYIDPKQLMKNKPIFPSICMKCGYKREIFEILIPVNE